MPLCFDGVLAPRGSEVLRRSGPLIYSTPGSAPLLIDLRGPKPPCGVKLVCGPYVYGEGLAAEFLGDPPGFFKGDYDTLGPPEGLEGADAGRGGFVENAVFNPFSWRPVVPIPASMPGCVDTEFGPYSPPNLDPASSSEAGLRCVQPRGGGGEGSVDAGGAVLTLNWVRRIGGLTVGGSEGFTAVASGDAAIIIPHGSGVSVTLRTPAASYRVGMLYGLAFEEPVPGGEYFGNLVVLSGPGLEVSIASPAGARVSLAPGIVEVYSREAFALVGGGVSRGFKALVELLYSYSLLDRAPARIGNFYSVKSFAYITRVDSRAIEFKAAALKGAGGGTVYLNPPFRSRLVKVETLLGETEMPGGPRVSVPVAECGCARARIHAGGGLLMRIVERRGSGL
ncbi:hypothetical protein [Aeropyrum pernix]|uniref:hypothetical protein n=1 Tax=Aeropyrum pernix TaxID=56636 RepID=UPI00103739F1|nr:hypothetical protein [Aeropyrum pernix]